MIAPRQIHLFNGAVSSQAEHAAVEILRSGQIASGPKVELFEQRVSEWVGGRPVVCTHDMTSALTMALRLAGVGHGDEVLTLAWSCMSSNAPISLVGATPVWVDIDPATAAMSLEDLQAALTPRSKAVMLYHAAGYPGPAAEIRKICDERGLALIEDANNAFGSARQGSFAGALGHFAVLSFYPNRQVNALEGGALICPDENVAERAKRLRRFGIDPTTFRDSQGEINPKADIPEIGVSATLAQVNAAVGLTHLESLKFRLDCTRQNARHLMERLAGLPGFTPVQTLPDAQSAYWGLLALVEPRDALLTFLKERGISASKLHHRNDCYSGFRAPQRSLFGTSLFAERVIALPCGWWLESDDIEFVANAVKAQLQ